MSNTKPKLHVLLAVWGETYVERLADAGLRSFMAPGNLPAASERMDVTLVFLTRREDYDTVDRVCEEIGVGNYAKIDRVPIDDLIADGPYSVTLTIAFGRGMLRAGEEMTDINFMFWNADFVLSAGGMSHLADRIERGENVVLCPSLRGIADEVEPQIASNYDARHLVGLALDAPHVMTVAKTVNQSEWHSIVPNQLFWKVDDTTLIGRSFQIFMLCLKPTVVVEAISGYCDFSFVPLFCPGEPIHVVDDSDDIFLLELQARYQEADQLRPGPFDCNKVAKQISLWVTGEHAEAARHPVVFHSGAIPPQTEEIKRLSQDYIEKIEQRVRTNWNPLEHLYWVSGLAAWASSPKVSALPCEVDNTLSAHGIRKLDIEAAHLEVQDEGEAIAEAMEIDSVEMLSSAQTSRQQNRRRLFGQAPHVGWLHPQWHVYRVVAPLLDSVEGTPKLPALIVANMPYPMHAVPASRSVYHLSTELLSTWRLKPQPAFGQATLILDNWGPQRSLRKLVRNAIGAMAPGSELRLILIRRADFNSDTWDHSRLAEVATISHPRIESLSWETVEPPASEAAYSLRFHKLFVAVASRRPAALIGALIKTPFVLAMRLLPLGGRKTFSAEVRVGTIRVKG